MKNDQILQVKEIGNRGNNFYMKNLQISIVTYNVMFT